MQNFLRILGFARPIGIKAVLYLLLTLGATIFGVINLAALIPLLQLLFEQSELEQINLPEPSISLEYCKEFFYHHFNEIIIGEGPLKALYVICGLMILAVLLANLFRYASQVLLARVRVNMIYNLRSAAYRGILMASASYLSSQQKGDLISRVTSDVQEVEQTVINAMKAIIKDPLLIIGYFVVLFSISIELTLYTLALAPITGFIVSLVARRIKKWSRQSQKSMGAITSIMDETIGGSRIIKAFSAENQMKKRFGKALEGYAQGVFEIAKKSNLASPISEVMGTAVLCLLLILGGMMVLNPEANLGPAQFIGFLIIFSQVLIPTKAISVAVSQMSRGLAASERVFQILDQSAENQESETEISKPTLNKGVRFESVCFAYDDDLVIDNVSFEIPKGKIIALAGPSGSGKSTLVDLLCGFRRVKSGGIFIDDTNLNHLSREQWLSMVGYVSQQPVLFNDTIANNISFGRQNTTPKAIENAAKKAHAHDFILKLSHGYDTVIGDGGDKLSGGEKQRITIARAILEDPPILILDEATSSLDAKSEEAVRQALLEVIQNRTVLIISHQMGTIREADEIILIENGKNVGRGVHEKLMKESDLYQQLVELQAF
ncbi:MAG: ABC transporter ATP-binding protein [Cyclobacteriaceae bacterium]